MSLHPGDHTQTSNPGASHRITESFLVLFHIHEGVALKGSDSLPDSEQAESHQLH